MLLAHTFIALSQSNFFSFRNLILVQTHEKTNDSCYCNKKRTQKPKWMKTYISLPFFCRFTLLTFGWSSWTPEEKSHNQSKRERENETEPRYKVIKLKQFLLNVIRYAERSNEQWIELTFFPTIKWWKAWHTNQMDWFFPTSNSFMCIKFMRTNRFTEPNDGILTFYIYQFWEYFHKAENIFFNPTFCLNWS